MKIQTSTPTTPDVFHAFPNGEVTIPPDPFETNIREMARAGFKSFLNGDGPGLVSLIIDAERARILLGLNWTGNRKQNLAHIKFLKLEMIAGRWREACQDNIVITPDDDGDLSVINGQHRLAALIEASEVQGPDFALPFTFAFGPDVDSYRVMDTGVVRGADSALTNEGCAHPKIAAAAIKGALHYLEGGAPDGRGGRISPEKVHEAYCEWRDEVETALEAGMRFGNRQGGPLMLNQSTAVAIGLLILLTSKACADPLEVLSFFVKLDTGYGIADGRDPVGKARKELQRLPEREAKGQRAAIVVKAWNALHRGPKNGIASWRATDPREPFPRIL